GKSRLFRNNVGAYQDKEGNWVRYGLGGKGASDLIGWKQIAITPEDVGRTIAQFLAVEVKQTGKKLTKDQQQFGNMVSSAGGIFGVAHSPEEAEQIIGC
ncbi:MAG: VRR-NUC domain-containing protein, partial [Lysobacterales bacterium]